MGRWNIREVLLQTREGGEEHRLGVVGVPLAYKRGAQEALREESAPMRGPGVVSLCPNLA